MPRVLLLDNTFLWPILATYTQIAGVPYISIAYFLSDTYSNPIMYHGDIKLRAIVE